MNMKRQPAGCLFANLHKCHFIQILRFAQDDISLHFNYIHHVGDMADTGDVIGDGVACGDDA